MRKRICYGVGALIGALSFAFNLCRMAQGGGLRAMQAAGLLLGAAGAAALLGSGLELLSTLLTNRWPDCPKHRLRLRWGPAGLYYGCEGCGRRWLPRRSWRLLRLAGGLATVVVGFLAMRVVYLALTGDEVTAEGMLDFISLCGGALILVTPLLVNGLAHRFLMRRDHWDNLGWPLFLQAGGER